MPNTFYQNSVREIAYQELCQRYKSEESDYNLQQINNHAKDERPGKIMSLIYRSYGALYGAFSTKFNFDVFNKGMSLCIEIFPTTLGVKKADKISTRIIQPQKNSPESSRSSDYHDAFDPGETLKEAQSFQQRADELLVSSHQLAELISTTPQSLTNAVSKNTESTSALKSINTDDIAQQHNQIRDAQTKSKATLEAAEAAVSELRNLATKKIEEKEKTLTKTISILQEGITEAVLLKEDTKKIPDIKKFTIELENSIKNAGKILEETIRLKNTLKKTEKLEEKLTLIQKHEIAPSSLVSEKLLNELRETISIQFGEANKQALSINGKISQATLLQKALEAPLTLTEKEPIVFSLGEKTASDTGKALTKLAADQQSLSSLEKEAEAVLKDAQDELVKEKTSVLQELETIKEKMRTVKKGVDENYTHFNTRLEIEELQKKCNQLKEHETDGTTFQETSEECKNLSEKIKEIISIGLASEEIEKSAQALSPNLEELKSSLSRIKKIPNSESKTIKEEGLLQNTLKLLEKVKKKEGLNSLKEAAQLQTQLSKLKDELETANASIKEKIINLIPERQLTLEVRKRKVQETLSQSKGILQKNNTLSKEWNSKIFTIQKKSEKTLDTNATIEQVEEMQQHVTSLNTEATNLLEEITEADRKNRQEIKKESQKTLKEVKKIEKESDKICERVEKLSQCLPPSKILNEAKLAKSILTNNLTSNAKEFEHEENQRLNIAKRRAEEYKEKAVKALRIVSDQAKLSLISQAKQKEQQASSIQKELESLNNDLSLLEEITNIDQNLQNSITKIQSYTGGIKEQVASEIKNLAKTQIDEADTFKQIQKKINIELPDVRQLRELYNEELKRVRSHVTQKAQANQTNLQEKNPNLQKKVNLEQLEAVESTNAKKLKKIHKNIVESELQIKISSIRKQGRENLQRINTFLKEMDSYEKELNLLKEVKFSSKNSETLSKKIQSQKEEALKNRGRITEALTGLNEKQIGIAEKTISIKSPDSSEIKKEMEVVFNEAKTNKEQDFIIFKKTIDGLINHNLIVRTAKGSWELYQGAKSISDLVTGYRLLISESKEIEKFVLSAASKKLDGLNHISQQVSFLSEDLAHSKNLPRDPSQLAKEITSLKGSIERTNNSIKESSNNLNDETASILSSTDSIANRYEKVVSSYNEHLESLKEELAEKIEVLSANQEERTHNLNILNELTTIEELSEIYKNILQKEEENSLMKVEEKRKALEKAGEKIKFYKNQAALLSKLPVNSEKFKEFQKAIDQTQGNIQQLDKVFPKTEEQIKQQPVNDEWITRALNLKIPDYLNIQKILKDITKELEKDIQDQLMTLKEGIGILEQKELIEKGTFQDFFEFCEGELTLSQFEDIYLGLNQRNLELETFLQNITTEKMGILEEIQEEVTSFSQSLDDFNIDTSAAKNEIFQLNSEIDTAKGEIEGLSTNWNGETLSTNIVKINDLTEVLIQKSAAITQQYAILFQQVKNNVIEKAEELRQFNIDPTEFFDRIEQAKNVAEINQVEVYIQNIEIQVKKQELANLQAKMDLFEQNIETIQKLPHNPTTALDIKNDLINLRKEVSDSANQIELPDTAVIQHKINSAISETLNIISSNTSSIRDQIQELKTLGLVNPGQIPDVTSTGFVFNPTTESLQEKNSDLESLIGHFATLVKETGPIRMQILSKEIHDLKSNAESFRRLKISTDNLDNTISLAEEAIRESLNAINQLPKDNPNFSGIKSLTELIIERRDLAKKEHSQLINGTKKILSGRAITAIKELSNPFQQGRNYNHLQERIKKAKTAEELEKIALEVKQLELEGINSQKSEELEAIDDLKTQVESEENTIPPEKEFLKQLLLTCEEQLEKADKVFKYCTEDFQEDLLSTPPSYTSDFETFKNHLLEYQKETLSRINDAVNNVKEKFNHDITRFRRGDKISLIQNINSLNAEESDLLPKLNDINIEIEQKKLLLPKKKRSREEEEFDFIARAQKIAKKEEKMSDD